MGRLQRLLRVLFIGILLPLILELMGVLFAFFSCNVAMILFYSVFFIDGCSLSPCSAEPLCDVFNLHSREKVLGT